jgi:predicted 2-oxoglutarate/Fe(II)-dependent dioxygenase YbiX
MNEHADTAGDFAAIYYINDDYEGGEINFMDHNLKIKPKANSFITFPSNSDYWHEVLQNTVKERYSSTLWFKFVGSEMLRPELGLIR